MASRLHVVEEIPSLPATLLALVHLRHAVARTMPHDAGQRPGEASLPPEIDVRFTDRSEIVIDIDFRTSEARAQAYGRFASKLVPGYEFCNPVQTMHGRRFRLSVTPAVSA